MPPRDRSSIRYEQFVKPRRKRWPGLMAALLLTLVAGGAAYIFLGNESAAHAPPPALSNTGGPVEGEAYQWKAVAIGGGGFITGLSQDGSGTTFVIRSDVYGGYIWDAKADRWKQLITAAAMPEQDRVQDGIAQGVYEIAVAPSRPERIYMAVKGQVYRTDDAGKRWVLASAQPPFPLFIDKKSGVRLKNHKSTIATRG